MEQTYYRFKASKLSRKAFCEAEGLNLAQFAYWCQRFDKELPLTTSPVPELKLVEVPASTPKPAKGKTVVASKSVTIAPLIDPAPGFKQLTLPDTDPTERTPTLSTGVADPTPVPPTPVMNQSPTATPVMVNTPLMVLDLPGKGRLEFYAPVEAEFFVHDSSERMLALSSSCRYFLYGKGTDLRCS